MRPLSISLEGFFAYRRPTELDLEGADYFSLSGPTGSGKSSLVDAMIFALYGRVPRLGGRDVAPAISAGSDRARVSLRFLVGERIYTATRLLQRTKTGGATTKEARLESDDLEPVSGAADVTARVTELLRLDFDDFTKTVVLPQGEFARFLQASPGDRQEILRNLLGLGVYRKMGELARQRSQQAQAEADSSQKLLDSLGVPDPQAVEDAVGRKEAIDVLAKSVAAMESQLDGSTKELETLRAEVGTSDDAVMRLQSMRAPDHLGETAEMIRMAEQSIETLTDRVDAADVRISSIGQAIGDLPDAATIDRFASLHQRLEDVESSLQSLDLDEQRSALADAEVASAKATEELATSKAHYESLRGTHAAHELARGLSPGDTCPVCANTVGTTLEIDAPPDLEMAKTEVAAAASRVESAKEVVSAAGRRLSADQAAHGQLVAKRLEIIGDLGPDPIPEPELGALAERRKSFEESLAVAQAEREESRAKLKDEEGRLADLAETQRSLTTLLIAERDKVGDLKPDLPMSEDPEIGWKELLTWRDKALRDREEVLADLKRRLQSVGASVESVKATLTESLLEFGIEPEWPAAVAVARAQEKAGNLVKTHEDLEEKASELRKRAVSASEHADVASGLATHLKANGFERWLMLGAVSQLVDRANSVLDELSGSVYSLLADIDGSFDIIDHRNADEVRPISTLSGGETFMVSLALALALAETLASGGAGRLESIILDEGFGTLDQESIDVVAGVLESLSETGLMVGIITHVADLARRAPVRFEVHKGPDGSTISGLSQ